MGRGELKEVLRKARSDETEPKAHRADEHRNDHPEAVGEPSHQHAAQSEPDHGEREGKRGITPRDPELRLQRGQRHRDGIHPRSADRHQGERGPEAGPGVRGIGAVRCLEGSHTGRARRSVNASNAAVTASSTRAERASDQWMPMSPPTTPMVTPEKARMPRAHRMYSPITRPRIGAGACSWTSVCAIALNESSRKPTANRTASASAEDFEAAK